MQLNAAISTSWQTVCPLTLRTDKIPSAVDPLADRSGRMPFAETKSLLESIPVEFGPGQLEFPLPREILEAAAEIADGSDVIGLERARLERLVRVVLAMDRARPDKSP